jgi:hypothetical protein
MPTTLFLPNVTTHYLEFCVSHVQFFVIGSLIWMHIVGIQLIFIWVNKKFVYLPQCSDLKVTYTYKQGG